MTKEQIVAAAAAAAGISKSKTAVVLNSAIASVVNALSKGDKVTFVGFGTFSTSKRSARAGRNPRTGAKLQIPATTVPKFKAGRKLKEAVAKKK